MMGSLGREPDSAKARSRKAPANPRTALPRVGKIPAEDSLPLKPRKATEGREALRSGVSAESTDGLLRKQGALDSRAASVEAASPLSVTGPDCIVQFDSKAVRRDSRSRRRALSCSTTGLRLSTACGIRNSAYGSLEASWCRAPEIPQKRIWDAQLSTAAEL